MNRGGGVRFPEKSAIWATRHLSQAEAAAWFPRGPVTIPGGCIFFYRYLNLKSAVFPRIQQPNKGF